MISISRKYLTGTFCAEMVVTFGLRDGVCRGGILLNHETGEALQCTAHSGPFHSVPIEVLHGNPCLSLGPEILVQSP